MGETGDRIIAVLLAVPCGRVATYSGIAAMAGIPNGARTVARLLHSSSSAHGLPWWRIVRADGSIALSRGDGFEEQAARLSAEGIAIGPDGKIDIAEFGWRR